MAVCISELEEDLLQYCDFEEVGSVANAKRFITSAKRWLIVQPTRTRDQNAELYFQQAQIQELMKRAQDYVAANDTDANLGVRFLGISDSFRG